MLTFNNTEIEAINFGDTDIETGLFNGVTVFEKRKENIVILRTTQPTLRLSVFTKEGLDVDVWNAGEKVAVLGNTGRVDFRLKDTGQDVIIKGHDIIKLFCNENQLTSLNAQGCTALQELYCYNNQLTSLNVQGCTALRALLCNDNQLTSLNAQGLTALQELFCNENQLTSLNVQGCTVLQRLYCYNNQLTSLNVQGCTALRALLCYNNQLTSLNVQGCTALQGLHCNDNQLTSLNAQGLTVLKRLYCYNNQLTAHAFKDIFINLAKTKWEGISILYKDRDSNYSDFTQPPELAAAFNAAKAKGWMFYKNSQNSKNLL